MPEKNKNTTKKSLEPKTERKTVYFSKICLINLKFYLNRDKNQKMI